MTRIDSICYLSELRYANASEKLLYAVMTMIVCILIRSIPSNAAVIVVNLYLTVRRGKIPLFCCLKLLSVPLVFILAGTFVVIVNFSGTPMDAFALKIGKWYITGTTESVRWGIKLCFTAMASVTCLNMLSLNTTMTDITSVLRKLRLPDLIIELMTLIYRFIFLLTGTAAEISIAQRSRLGNRNFRTRIRSFGSMGISLFILSVRRSGQIYDAMESRGYDGKIRSIREDRPVSPANIICILLFDALLTVPAAIRLF